MFKVRSFMDCNIVTKSTHIYDRMIERQMTIRDFLYLLEEALDDVLDEVDSGFEIMIRSKSLRKSIVFVAEYNENNDIIDIGMITCINKFAVVSDKDAYKTHVYDVA
jgi:hypothetical protein